MITVAIHWPRFGPYHLARINAAHRYLRELNIKVVGIETASRDHIYRWRQEVEPTTFERYTVFSNHIAEEITFLRLWKPVCEVLNSLAPDVVAINGYGSWDSLTLLLWCFLHNRSPILMSESKKDDTSRMLYKELPKRFIVQRFASALCGGTPHKNYLTQLGLASSRIFTGYDAVDNDYFWNNAECARKNKLQYQQLPGLETTPPYFLASSRFIMRKNIDGLLVAYAKYRTQMTIKKQLPWRLIILGDGDERRYLQRLAGELNLSDVIWPGFRQIDELPAFYGLARAFIHPAREEQWGLVVNEAMASGLPVLVSKTCGCASDLVVEGQTGFTFDPDNSEELASLMVRLGSGQIDLATMGQAARMQINNWGPKHFAEGLYLAIQAALSNTKVNSRNQFISMK